MTLKKNNPGCGCCGEECEICEAGDRMPDELQLDVGFFAATYIISRGATYAVKSSCGGTVNPEASPNDVVICCWESEPFDMVSPGIGGTRSYVWRFTVWYFPILGFVGGNYLDCYTDDAGPTWKTLWYYQNLFSDGSGVYVPCLSDLPHTSPAPIPECVLFSSPGTVTLKVP